MRKQKTLQKIFAAFLAAVFAASGEGSVFAAYDADSTSFVGIRKSSTAKILDDFKERQNETFFENAPFTVEEEFGMFDAERKMNGLEQVLKRLENTRNQFQERKLAVTQEKVTLRNTVKKLDESVEATMASIRRAEQEIIRNTREIAEYERKIVELKAKIAENRKAILEYLAYVYSRGDLMYSEGQDLDIVKSIILNDGNLSDILTDLHYKSLLQTAGQNFVEIRRSLVAEYYLESEKLKKHKVQALRLKRELRDRRTELQSQREYKERLLRVTQGQEALFNRFIMQKRDREKEISASLRSMQSEYDSVFEDVSSRTGCEFESVSTDSRAVPDSESASGALAATGAKAEAKDFSKLVSGPVAKCRDLAKFYAAEKELRENRGAPASPQSPFLWPAVPKYVSAYYHDQEYYDSVGSEHEAVDLAVAQGTDIVAPANGYVYFVNPPVEGGYGYVALKHSDGLLTVYGHVSEVLYERFQFVPAGATFARSGGAPGTPGAGVMTTGPHLHFEVYKNRESVDPLRFLDLTYLRYESLDPKYSYKYAEDLKVRYGRRANLDGKGVFSLSGEDETARQKDLLSKYAASAFSDWNLWIEEGASGKIDPSFLMCVGLAETGLGRNLKTGYNVGNVGNTDSGGTYEFANAREGIYWMTKTLNNRFLGQYDRISDLSRWGNKSGSIYASSSKHWHTNVVRCLSALKGRFVEDEFKFRIVSGNDLSDPEAEVSKLLKTRKKNVVAKKSVTSPV